MPTFTAIDNNNHQRQVTFSVQQATLQTLLAAASNKLRIKASCIYNEGGEALTADFPNKIYVAKNSQSFAATPKHDQKAPITMLAKAAEVNQEAIQHLEAVARLPGVVAVHAMPDIHEGPNGCCISTEKCIYPYLIGSDIHCGVSVFLADQTLLKFNNTVESVPVQPAWLQKIRDLTGLKPGEYDDQLGSIGAGNHFAEICHIKEISHEAVAEQLGINADSVLLLVHSGSRAFGKDIFRQTTQKCIHENTPAFDTFMRQHDEAGKWAKANRLLIATKMLGDVSHPIIDISHNFVTKLEDRFLCRKGAASTNQGPVILPGSRGTSSFILNPTVVSDATGWSGPHGCGRRLSRNSASLKASKKNYRETSTIIGGSKTILNEEIPAAYKPVDDVLQDMLPYADVVAELTPLKTFKS